MKFYILVDISSLVFICVSCQHYVASDVIDIDIPGNSISSTDSLITTVRNATDINGSSNYCASSVSLKNGKNLTWSETEIGGIVRILKEYSICDAKDVRVCLEEGQWGNVTSEPESCYSDKVLRVLVYIGFSMSLVSCVISFIIFLLTRSSLRSIIHYQYHIHWNLITSFILYHVVFLVAYVLVPTGMLTDLKLRNLLNVLLAYVVLANFFWMLVEGLVLFVLVATPFPGEQRGRAFIKWFLIGWGIPAVLVATWMIIVKALTPAESDFALNVNNGHIVNYVCLVGPVFVALLINCIVVVVVMRILWLKLKADVRTGTSESEEKSWRTAKSTFVLLILLGVYYALPILLFVFEPPYMLTYVVSYISNLVSSMQGLAVSTFYVFCNAEVRRALRNHRRQLRYNSPMTYSTRLSSRNSSRNGTPRHSKSHSSSDGCGKRSNKDGEDIEMIPSDINCNTNENHREKRDMCVIMEHAPLAVEESYNCIHGYVRLSANEPDDV